MRIHPDEADPGLDPSDPMSLTPRGPSDAGADGVPDEVLRLAFRYPDGATATTLDEPGGAAGPEEEPEGPLLLHRSSRGSGASWDYELWLWPLPEAGGEPLEVLVEWPAEGIEESRAELDVEPLRAAAQRGVQLWTDDGRR